MVTQVKNGKVSHLMYEWVQGGWFHNGVPSIMRSLCGYNPKWEDMKPYSKKPLCGQCKRLKRVQDRRLRDFIAEKVAEGA